MSSDPRQSERFNQGKDDDGSWSPRARAAGVGLRPNPRSTPTMVSKRGETAPEGSTKGPRDQAADARADEHAPRQDGRPTAEAATRRTRSCSRTLRRRLPGTPSSAPPRGPTRSVSLRPPPRASRGATLRAEEAPPPLAEALAAVEAAQLVHVAAEVVPDAPRYYITLYDMT